MLKNNLTIGLFLITTLITSTFAQGFLHADGDEIVDGG